MEEAALTEAMATDADENKDMSTDQTVEDMTKAVEEAMEEAEMPPSPSKLDVSKAQEELQGIDVLVCGKCHNTFHFIDEFQIHKSGECPGLSVLASTNSKNESKAQVWAFLLYKTKKMQESTESNSSWQWYQKWSKLSENIRKSWLQAGKTVLELYTFLPSQKEIPKFTPLKGKVKPVLTASEREQEQQTLMALQKQLEDGETQIMSTLGLVRGKGEKELRLGPNQLWRKKKDDDDDDDEIVTVQKIVAKRMNPKSRQPEYLVKWEGLPSDQNTWESIQNMANCMKLIQEFEKSLAKQKARKALEASKSQMISQKQLRLDDLVDTPPNSQGRPVRSSALKALDQVKEWVGAGAKRKLDSDEDSDDEVPAKRDAAAELGAILRRKAPPSGKAPYMVAHSKGVVRIDPKTVPNLTSGVYILSSSSGLIKVDDPTAARLQEVMKVEGKKMMSNDTNSKTMMIHETEVRKIPAGNATPKLSIMRKDAPSTIIRKESPSAIKVMQKTRPVQSQAPVRIGTQIRQQSSALSRQIILGKNKPRPLPGPVPSPFRPPLLKQRFQAGRQLVVPQKEKLSDDDFDGGLPDEFPKDDEPIAPASPTRPMTLCPLTGETLARAEGEKTPPHDDEANADNEEENVVGMQMSPGGTLRHVVQRVRQQRPRQQRSLLTQRRQAKMQLEEQEQEMISIEGSDGVLYITPEQQQMLLQNGSITMQEDKSEEVSTVVLPQEALTQEQAELLIKNGQIVERHLVTDENSADEQSVLLGGQTFIEGEDGGVYSGVLTLDSAVQEAISQAAADQAEGDDGTKADDGQQMVAQIVQAEPPTPGGGPRKVVLLLPDGSLVNTEMAEEEYQALDFEK